MKRFAVLLLFCASLCSAAGGLFEKGTRLGVNLVSILSDGDFWKYPYVSASGLGGTASFDVAFGVSERLYVHTALALDCRVFFMYEEYAAAYSGMSGDGGSYIDDGYSTEVYIDDGYSTEVFLLLEVPLLAQWRVTPKFFVEGGVLFDVTVADFASLVGEAPDWDSDREDRTFGFSVAAGVGYRFVSGVSLDFRTSFQLNDLIWKPYTEISYVEGARREEVDGEVVEEATVIRERTRGSYFKMLKFQLGVGYWF